MSRRPKHRDAIVSAALTLFRRQGYAATGLNDIVASSGAPKGSLYHYFPDGKLSIAQAAVRQGGALVASTLDELAGSTGTAGELVAAYGARLAQWMSQSHFHDGCPIAATLLETTPAEPGIALAGREALAAWRRPIAAKLKARGLEAARAEVLAGFAIAALEGSLIQARVEQSADCIHAAAAEAGRLLDGPEPPPLSAGLKA